MDTMSRKSDPSATVGGVRYFPAENPIYLTDSYKLSHWKQMRPGTQRISEYLEARSAKIYSFSRFFGLQSIIKRHLLTPITHAHVDQAAADFARHVRPDSFNEKGWRRIVDVHGGRLPVEIRAVPEGMDIPVHNVLMQVVNTDPDAYWLPTYLESVLQQVWAPTTVATKSGSVRFARAAAFEQSAENPDAKQDFSLHDFAFRGLPSVETARILGLAHLLVYFGTDTVVALREAEEFYNATDVCGFSIEAGEHSEILSWGRDGEEAYFRNLFLGRPQDGIGPGLAPGTIVAAPIDTYDMRNCLERIVCGSLRDVIRDSGGTYVARPDSGDPREVVPYVLRTLADAFGAERNARGYLVLHPSVRSIFGDSLDQTKIDATDKAVLDAGFSVENVAYGMGAGLSQKINRDDLGFAVKASAFENEDGWFGNRKSIVGDPAKASKAGRLALVENGEGWSDYGTGRYQTVEVENLHGRADLLRPVYRDGELLVDDDFATIRARARANEQPAI